MSGPSPLGTAAERRATREGCHGLHGLARCHSGLHIDFAWSPRDAWPSPDEDLA